jgi:hypothetical protein
VYLIVKVWLKSLAFPGGEEGGKFLVQIISTVPVFATHSGGGRGSAACGPNCVENLQTTGSAEAVVLVRKLNQLIPLC